ncbi:unnamed protein product [Polarella glacialis]|uniref:Uncharacterized protein n=1 Tax=Polarella glacialis TaxID=89957 RepID=A0A813FQS6_POLGL|nr:unnamed protein product [Polarella glacialis]
MSSSQAWHAISRCITGTCVALATATQLALPESKLHETAGYEAWDFLLWPYRDVPLRVVSQEVDASFLNAESLPDIVRGPPELIWNIMHGGLVLTEFTPEVRRALHRVAFMSPYEGRPDPFRRAKLVVVAGGQALLVSKGCLDDNDHFTLGDYGNEYGEYRWGVFSRFIQRMLPQFSSETDAYFKLQSSVLALPIEVVMIELKFSNEIKHDMIHFKTREGERRSIAQGIPFQEAVIKDISFALAVHKERIFVELVGQMIRVTIRDAKVQDYDLHIKQRPWNTWTSYFGPADPQPLSVVAQTAREKSLMVGDDLSDLYNGRVTAAIPQGEVSVAVTSPDCSGFREALSLHQFRCLSAQSGTRAPPHSALYSLAAKEKLSGDLGTAAESSLKAILARNRHAWPDLAVLHIEGKTASLEVFEGRRLTKGLKLRALTAKLHHGVDLLHLHSCKIPAPALDVLADGGLVLIEGVDCTKPEAFDRFLGQALEIGAVAIGRRIAVIIKPGRYRVDPRRALWPRMREETPMARAEL